MELDARVATLRLAETFVISRESSDSAEVVQVELRAGTATGYFTKVAGPFPAPEAEAQVPRYLHFNPYAQEPGGTGEISVAAKTGFYPGTRTDAGAVFVGDRTSLVYCAMTAAGRDGSLSPENEGAVVAGVLGRLMIERWWPRDLGAPPLVESPHVRLFLGSRGGP